ncbi:MAG: alpha/beta hydrolase [Saprospiraceae bacterium]|nr:alpha/beta hydrolase [Saprospiraceae bacterium]
MKHEPEINAVARPHRFLLLRKSCCSSTANLPALRHWLHPQFQARRKPRKNGGERLEGRVHDRNFRGGYSGTATDHEGTQVAKALTEAGITAFVLKYRIPSDRYCVDKSLAPLQDAQQAIRLVRLRAAEWQLNPNKIGIMGFSAGGHLAATAATHFEQNADPTCTDLTSVRPDFVALIYPVVSFRDGIGHDGSRENLLGKSPTLQQTAHFSNELRVTPQSPPAFLVHAQDDWVKIENSLLFYEACLRNGVPVEAHFWVKGGHGFGMVNPVTKVSWVPWLVAWMNGI